MKCKRCNRELKSEDSIKLCYGPTCAAKEGIVIPSKLKVKKYRGKDILKFINV